jgi:hypothetical protein
MNLHTQRLVLATALATAAFAQAGAAIPGAEGTPKQGIVLACSKAHPPIMTDVARAIDASDYWAPRDVRREMLVLARDACATKPGAVLTFVPPKRNDALDAPMASK